ncbi:glucosamine kinase [Janthinobacterium sp. CG_23.3]|uniref:BadF/BadG/BcrA/BcrD ATPase family protein n=1 Tax=unclassified Janthinobacterium TaxID=2610881 RepID=UPI00034B05A6|nr:MULTISPECIES: BadF/BadG/BcrA/BcrD ATPase family protein [unclassified Janthinobacterium]MEC5160130.1 glucosamine kinase [Janthinobacterium sp. CG_S6]
MTTTQADSPAGLGLGIDAGGTQTRWALAAASGRIVAEGQWPGLSALQLASEGGRRSLRAAFAGLCAEVLAAGRPGRVRAGLTGFGGDAALPAGWLAELLSIAPQAVTLCNDIEIAYLDSFQPGQGYLVYAGTGSIAAWIDGDGALHRAGGRGVTLDDGGGGFWIAREAMRQVWRREDECPGSWQDCALAKALFAQIGGSDWALSRNFIYAQERGAIGKLALAVAAAADTDPAAYAILQQAGRELARLALALTARYGARPVVLAGRAAGLHPAIAAAMRAALPETVALEQRVVRPHWAAARLAAQEGQGPGRMP